MNETKKEIVRSSLDGIERALSSIMLYRRICILNGMPKEEIDELIADIGAMHMRRMDKYGSMGVMLEMARNAVINKAKIEELRKDLEDRFGGK